ncbi:2TM domain-containing protein [Piscinibacter koreensis]|uniref:2TM domain-containing protein n=1 Tax=Piscinibacter koreensis TaxID=2742824 RepID=A0A7Y6NLY4_9BURK|nr:2TM domain-containing protein [Schlegelella koreensis]NUZ05610.1 2TM domain-containing protein [Schlegelella koreensis]
MANTFTPHDMEQLARRRANGKLGWYIHATVYVLVNLGLFLASEHAFGDRRFTMFPLLGWGLGLALHGASIWLLGGGSALRERMVQRELERLERDRDGR